MLANLVYCALIWTLTSGITALILLLTVFRKTPRLGADAAMEFEVEVAEMDRIVFYRGGDKSVIFDSAEREA